jgi:hypothetical protein
MPHGRGSVVIATGRAGGVNPEGISQIRMASCQSSSERRSCNGPCGCRPWGGLITALTRIWQTRLQDYC